MYRILAGVLAALGATAAGCASGPPLEPESGRAILIADTELVAEPVDGTESSVLAYSPACVFDAAGERLYARLHGYRHAPWVMLDPGRYVVVSEVRGERRAVHVQVAPGERRVVRYAEIARGSRFDG